MIKFFRKIRQKLLSENKFSKYLLYAIGEIILVVIGILIALQINNWNENRKLTETKRNYYQQILVDLKNDKTYSKYMISIIDSSLTRFDTYIKAYEKPDLTFSEIFENISTMPIGYTILKFESTTIESLINNSEMKLIDTELRNNFVNYNRQKQALLFIYSEITKKTDEILRDYSMDGGALIPKLKNQKELAKFIKMEQRYDKLYIKLDAYFAWKSDAEKKTIKGLKELIEQIENTEELIISELKK